MERFWSKVEKTEGCWLWTAYCGAEGYGRFPYPGGTLAHRFAYETTWGPIPAGLVIDHLCRNRQCVRPDHLEAVTQQANTLRGETVAARRAAQTECVKGHPFTPENTYRDKRGYRSCRICMRAANKRAKQTDKQRAFYRNRRKAPAFRAHYNAWKKQWKAARRVVSEPVSEGAQPSH